MYLGEHVTDAHKHLYCHFRPYVMIELLMGIHTRILMSMTASYALMIVSHMFVGR